MHISYLLLPLLSALADASGPQDEFPAELTGICEASAAAEVAPGILAVGDDDENDLYLYDLGDGRNLGRSELSEFLGVDPKDGIDIEGAARVGAATYWITSHSLNKNAKFKAERLNFFATQTTQTGGETQVVTFGRPYRALRDDILRAVTDQRWALADAANRSPERGLTLAETQSAAGQEPDAPSPEVAQLHREGGFNIEGLAEGPRGTLLLGFRGPVRNGLALIVPLKNPEALISAPAEGSEPSRAEFEPAIGVDLGGLGIRSMERMAGTDDYLISAGPVGDGPGFRLFRWSYGAGSASALDADTGHLIAEGLIFPSSRAGKALLLSDEGDTPRCTPPRFRASLIKVGARAPAR
jgi:hypothetical protein